MIYRIKDKTVWLVLFTVACLGAVTWIQVGFSVTENLIFSHQTHLIDQGIDDCTICHSSALVSTLSTDDLIPKKDVCSDCHDVEDSETCERCHARIPEIGGVKTARHAVIFNHARHLSLEGVTCTTCHVSPDQYAHFTFGEDLMNTVCVSCHSGIPGPSYCGTCHAEEVYQRAPSSHSEDFLTSHGRLVLAGLDTSCAACHSRDQFCSDCHQQPYVTKDGTDRAILNDPSSSEVDEPLVVPRVHELNYRYTHPLDAAAKTSDCTVCHRSLESCNQCHSPEGAAGSYRPLWHSSPDWLSLNGGLHAELAERDLERCVACHDVVEGEPICIKPGCHTRP